MPNDRRCDIACPRTQFVLRSGGKGVRYDNRRVVRHTELGRESLEYCFEGLRDDDRRWEAKRLEKQGVVQTARCTGSSSTHTGNDHIGTRRKIPSGVRVDCFTSRRLVVYLYRGHRKNPRDGLSDI